MSPNALATAHLVATLYMTGLIVFVQVVHYPLMAKVGRNGFVRYEAAHAMRTGWVVMLPMIVELGSAVWLYALPPNPSDRPLALLGLALVAVIWLSTALLQVPAHGRLSKGFDEKAHHRLVRTNWIRTVAWVARVPVALALLP